MVTLGSALEKFDASKAAVRKQIKEGFFDGQGKLIVSEGELRAWIADRAVDELKVVLELSHVLSNYAHVVPANILVQIASQIGDEARHFEILRGLVPAQLQAAIDEKARNLPEALESDSHWVSLRAAAEAGNPYALLLDINIVHEGYSAAAIEELANIPFEDIRLAYAAIGADEERHHESGRDLLLWLTDASGTKVDDSPAVLMESAHERAGGGAMDWSWPATSPVEVLGAAHERAAAGGAMDWSWPAARTGADR